jgi:hypothetical protein
MCTVLADCDASTGMVEVPTLVRLALKPTIVVAVVFMVLLVVIVLPCMTGVPFKVRITSVRIASFKPEEPFKVTLPPVTFGKTLLEAACSILEVVRRFTAPD